MLKPICVAAALGLLPSGSAFAHHSPSAYDVRSFPCQISFKGEPAFDAESDLWDVQYYASGDQCEEASNTFERQGKAFRVAFRRIR